MAAHFGNTEQRGLWLQWARKQDEWDSKRSQVGISHLSVQFYMYFAQRRNKLEYFTAKLSSGKARCVHPVIFYGLPKLRGVGHEHERSICLWMTF